MTIVRWEPVRESGALQHEINRLFGGFFEQPTGQASSGATQRQWVPAMDLVETDGAYVLRADLPGLGAGDVKIELEENVLTISGERETQHETATTASSAPRAPSLVRSRCQPASTPTASRPASATACSRCASPLPSSASHGA